MKTVLGIIDGAHDAGAALVADGRLVAAVSEERFTRTKGQGGWPARAIAHCLAGAARIDAVAFAGFTVPNPLLRTFRGLQARARLDDGGFPAPTGRWRDRVAGLQLRGPLAHLPSERSAIARPLLERVLRRDLRRAGIDAPIVLVDHHLAHAASAWRTCRSTDALVLVADGLGDGLALTVWRGSERGLERLAAMPHPHSYGLVYATVCAMYGFRPFRHEGKLVGLAGRGDADAVPEPFPFAGDVPARRFTGRLGARPGPWLDRLRRYRREDVCAWLQRGIEREILGLLRYFLGQTRLRRVAVAGGVFANVALNRRLAELPVDDAWIFPHMGDGGLCAGAALHAADARDPLDTVFLGPEPDDPEPAIRASGLPWSRPADLEGEIARILAAGGLVGRVEGRVAFGPRALGDRSILASAADAATAERLNERLRRDDFMPFAPVVLAEDAGDWLEVPPALERACGFMTTAVRVRGRMAEQCPAAVHVDGTARPQLVDRERHPSLHRVLSAYRQATGRPVLINTSFNVHEEPIVLTAGDALRCHVAAGLDATAIGPFLVGR